MRRLYVARTAQATAERRGGVCAILTLFAFAVGWGDMRVKPALPAALAWQLEVDAASADAITWWASLVGHTGMVAALCALGVTLMDDPGLAMTERYPPSTVLQPCVVCGVDRPVKGAHHCRICNVCTVGFDHHCGVLGTCIARRNHPYFIALLLSGGASMLLVVVCGLLTTFHKISEYASPAEALVAPGVVLWWVLWLLPVTGVAVALSAFGAVQLIIYACLNLTLHTASSANVSDSIWKSFLVRLLTKGFCLAGPNPMCSCFAKMLLCIHRVGDGGATSPSLQDEHRIRGWWYLHPRVRYGLLLSPIGCACLYTFIRIGATSSRGVLFLACVLICIATTHRLNFGRAPKSAAHEVAGSDSDEWDSSSTDGARDCRPCSHTTLPPLTSYCSVCEACIPGVDHHCGLFACCIGSHNRRTYCLLLAASGLGSAIVTIDAMAHFREARLPSLWERLATPWVLWTLRGTLTFFYTTGYDLLVIQAYGIFLVVSLVCALQQVAYLCYVHRVSGPFVDSLYALFGRNSHPGWGYREGELAHAVQMGDEERQLLTQ